LNRALSLWLMIIGLPPAAVVAPLPAFNNWKSSWDPFVFV
jgi:hypothetical protein